MALPLIDKQDNFEIIRDRIAAILAAETLAQVILATGASKPNPNDWKLRIFTERANPWEEFLNLQPGGDRSPLVNVWYDSGSFPRDKGEPLERQAHVAVYNIDCYGVGVSSAKGAGHKPGDREAALEVQRAIRLVRNTLMAGDNVYLGASDAERKTIGSTRWPQSITVFQPTVGDKPVQNIIGARIALESTFNEFSPQSAVETLEQVSVGMRRTEDGEIVLEADYPYPL